MIYEKKFDSINNGISFIEEKLKELKVSSKNAMKASLSCEAALLQLLEHQPDDKKEFVIKVKKSIFRIVVIIEARGDEFEFDAGSELNIDDIFKARMGGTDFVSDLIRHAYKKDIHIRNKRGVNQVNISVGKAENTELLITLAAFVLGCVAGLALNKFCSEQARANVDYYGFGMLKTLFMNALHIVVGPLVFFSLTSCISRFTNLSELGRLGIKTMALYILTTLCAIGIGIALFTAFPTGNPELKQYISIDESEDEEMLEVKEVVEDGGFSIRETIVDIIPDNVVKPFLSVNLLQIIFLALIIGISIGKCGSKAQYLNGFVESFNRLFMNITEIITKFIPVAIFCAMAELVMDTGVDILMVLLKYAALVVGGMICMIAFYCVFLAVFARVNPFVFLKKFSKAMITAFAVSSGAATMPASMECCRKMGIDNKVVSFSIPLGSNVNMDGSCMVFIITVLFMSRIYGIDMNGAMLASTVVSIVFLSLGSPSVAGADLVMLAVLMGQVGVPIEAIGLIMGIDAIFDMVQAVSNTTGDAVVALTVANSEGLLDKERFYS